jgi:hypothetical protein
MLKDEVENKIQLKKWIGSSTLVNLSYLDHKTRITLYKTNQNKLWSSILNQLNIKGRD